MNFKTIDRGELAQLDFFPLVVDFNFPDTKPRGGSAYIDFFSFGKLSGYMDGLSGSGVVYMRKNDLMPSQGVFLVDFEKISSGVVNFESVLSGMNIKKLYIENSSSYPIKDLIGGIQGAEIVLVNFK